MRNAPTLLAVACAWHLLSPPAAHAEPAAANPGERPAEAPRLTFTWSTPDGCPSRDSVLARAEGLLGHPLESSLKAPLVIGATVTSLGADTWELRLVSGDASAKPRLVSATSCAELAEMAALFTALSIDPTLRVEATARFPELTRPVPEASAQPAPAPPAAPPPAAPPPAVATPPARAPAPSAPPPAAPVARLRVRPVLGASFALGLGALPGVAPGVGAEGGLAFERLSLRAQLSYFPEQQAAVTDTTGGELSLGVAGVRAVYALTGGAANVALTGGVSLGWMHGTGTGVLNRDSGDALLLAFVPGARGAFALSPSFSLTLDAALTVAVNRPRFVLEGLGEVYRPPTLGARFGLGAEWCPP
jgi:hypothetical protein